jgi:hypothetical protein
MRRTMHRSSVARPRRPKPRVSWRISSESSNGGSGAAHRLVTAASDVYHAYNREPVGERRRAQPAHPSLHRRRGAPSSPRVYTVVMCTVYTPARRFLRILGGWAAWHRSLGAHGQLV